MIEKIRPLSDNFEIVEQKYFVTAFFDELNFRRFGPWRYTATNLFVRKIGNKVRRDS